MPSAFRSSWSRNKLVYAAALVLIGAGACHTSHFPYSKVATQERDSYFWNDFMPGPNRKPAFNVTYSVQLANASEADLRFVNVEALVVDDANGGTLRKFTPLIFVQDAAVHEILLPKSSAIDCIFRSPASRIEKIDTAAVKKIRLVLHLTTVDDDEFTITSKPSFIYITQ
jgi:hypothetical protein